MNAKTIESYAKLMQRHGLARLKVTSGDGSVELSAGVAPLPLADHASDDVDPVEQEKRLKEQAEALLFASAVS